MTEGWEQKAACRSDANLDAWFLGGAMDRPANAGALRICLTRCPVQTACLAYYERLPNTARISVIAGGIVWDSKGRPVQKAEAHHG